MIFSVPNQSLGIMKDMKLYKVYVKLCNILISFIGYRVVVLLLDPVQSAIVARANCISYAYSNIQRR